MSWCSQVAQADQFEQSMGQKVSLSHKTSYSFEKPAKLSPHLVRLRPASHGRTPISSYRLNVSPSEHFINWQQDPFGNHIARIVFPESVKELQIEVDLLAEMTPVNPFDFFLEPHVETAPFKYCLLYTSPSPRDKRQSRMPSSA